MLASKSIEDEAWRFAKLVTRIGQFEQLRRTEQCCDTPTQRRCGERCEY